MLITQAAPMEKLDILQCTTSGLKLLATAPSIEDIPDDCLELILERLTLVNHYKGWHSFLKPYSLRESLFNGHWFVKKLTVYCPSYICPEVSMDDLTSSNKVDDIDDIRSSGEVDDIDDFRSSAEVEDMNCITSSRGASPNFSVKPHSCWLLLADPGSGKEQMLGLNLGDGTEISGKDGTERGGFQVWTQQDQFGDSPWFATDKGF